MSHLRVVRLLAVNPAGPFSRCVLGAGKQQQVGSLGHPYRASDSTALPSAGTSAQGSRRDGAGLRGQGDLRHADDARAAGPLGHRRGAARICGWERKFEVPSDSRAFAEFSDTQLPQACTKR